MPPANGAPSALWLWGFWACTGAAIAAFILSLYIPAPVDRLLRGVAGALLIVGGVHQARVVAYKRVTGAEAKLAIERRSRLRGSR